MPPSTDPNHPNRRAFLGSLMAAPLLTAACRKTYDRYFTIEWDEEVELHNGRIIIVHIKRTFERVGSMRYERKNGSLRFTAIGFNAGGKIGYYQKEFSGYDVKYIHTSHGNWYISLAGQGSSNLSLVKQLILVWIIESNGNEKAARSISEVPHFPKLNLMPITPSPEGVEKFNGKMLTIPVKMAHWKKFPRAAGDNGKIINLKGEQPPPE